MKIESAILMSRCGIRTMAIVPMNRTQRCDPRNPLHGRPGSLAKSVRCSHSSGDLRPIVQESPHPRPRFLFQHLLANQALVELERIAFVAMR
jgi:hypothetical protein